MNIFLIDAPLFLDILHVVFSVSDKSRGNLNVECTVLPDCSRVEAIPEDATAIAIFFMERTFDNNKLIKYVLPVLPAALRKYIFSFFSLIFFNINK